MEELRKIIDINVKEILDYIKKSDNHLSVEYNEAGNLINHVVDFEGEDKSIYAFFLKEKETEDRAIVYIGKTESNSRFRQHLLEKNKNGTKLSGSVRTKYDKIKEAIKNGLCVYFVRYSDPKFDKTTLACMENACIEYLKAKENSLSWNVRNG